ncbi:MAG TPA: dTMP kinase [Terriglobia bacterium]|nr:dTMP kinase [Terriglobia bacterium]
MKRRGLLITLEGMDGSGKSTQLRLLAKYLEARRRRVTTTREPGGTAIGERIRAILLASSTRDLSPVAELALMYAARAQHLDEVIRPALKRGGIVLSDRYNDASMAYQGYGRRLGTAAVKALDRVICGSTQPDLTLVLDLPVRRSLGRAQGRDMRRNSHEARFEGEGLNFHDRVRRGYLAIARKNPKRVKLIRADRPVSEIQSEIRRHVETLLHRKSPS